jgi:cysteine desulfurase
MLATTVNVSFPGIDSEAAMVALKGVAAVSNGSACTSQVYTPSHVLRAMGLDPERSAGAVRISWSHLTPSLDWSAFVTALERLTTPAAA